jgi:hypothetical protein
VNLPLANENWPRHRDTAKLAATNRRALRWQEADRVPPAVPEALRRAGRLPDREAHQKSGRRPCDGPDPAHSGPMLKLTGRDREFGAARPRSHAGSRCAAAR